MINNSLYKNKIWDIFYFFLFILTPFSVAFSFVRILDLFSFRYFSIGNFWDIDQSFIFIVSYIIIFFILLFFIKKIYPENFKFLEKDNSWITDFSNALLPTAIAFASSFLLTVIFNIAVNSLIRLISNFYYINKSIKDWINSPNQAAIDFLTQIAKYRYINALLYLCYIVVFVPLYEEFCFRGVLFNFFSFNKNKNIDVVIISFIFSMFHIFSLSNTVFAFVMSLFLTYYRKKSNSIYISIWMHALTNFTMLFSAVIYYKIIPEW